MKMLQRQTYGYHRKLGKIWLFLPLLIINERIIFAVSGTALNNGYCIFQISIKKKEDIMGDDNGI